MAKISLKAEPRKLLGRKVKQLRAGGSIPANVYGKKIKSTSITIDSLEFDKVFKDAGETSLIDLTLGKDKKAVLVRNVQEDPVTSQVLHVDFQEVDLKAKINAQIPVEITGESQAEKQGLGTVVQHLDEIEVEALPADLPEKFEVDVNDLAEVDQAVHVGDLKVSDKVTIKANPEEIVVKVEPPQKEEEVAPVVSEEGASEEGVQEGESGEKEETKESADTPQESES